MSGALGGVVAPNVRARRVAGLVLAAGRSTRMGYNKLLCVFEGAPLVAHAADAALGAGLQPVCVVTGHEQDAVREALRGRDLLFAHNLEPELGMAASLRVGLRALGDELAAVVVLLGDMPRVRAAHVRRLLDAFEQGPLDAIWVPEHGGRRGNPVLWPARDLPELSALDGDVGGRALLQAHAARVQRVVMPDDGVLIDVDSPAMLSELQAAAAGRARDAAGTEGER